MLIPPRKFVWSVAALLLVVRLLDSGSAIAAAEPAITAEAYQGEPLGVGRMTIHLSNGQPPPDGGIWKLWLADPQRRAIHPAILVEKVQPVQEGGADGRDRRITAWFLFRGAAPLDVTLTGRTGYTLDPTPIGRTRVAPTENAAARRRLLDDWWGNYLTRLREIDQDLSWPGPVESSISSMLARRLELQPPFAARTSQDDGASLIADRMRASGSPFEAEAERKALQKDLLCTRTAAARPDQNLPEAAMHPALDIPDAPPETSIEPLAGHVPAECFYIRCRSIENFGWLWARAFPRGAQLLFLMTIRGVDDARPRLARQLGLANDLSYENPLRDLPAVDVAVIGTDGLLAEGAAIGLLFQTRDSARLQSALSHRRLAAISATNRATERTIEIEGHRVSFVSTPDNSVRSFHAVDGDFQLLTNSRMLVKRFFQAGAGKDCLANLREFRFARHVMALTRNDTLFAYVSEPFLSNLDSPQYRMEMFRRQQADAEIEIVHCARLAALAEKQPSETVEQLRAGGFLPEHFGVRSDGSHPILVRGRVIDSLRGGRRTFLPIPDVEITNVTQEEARGYAELVRRRSADRLAHVPAIAAVSRDPKIHGRGERRSQTDQVTVEIMLPGGSVRPDLPKALADAAKLPPVERDAVPLDAPMPILSGEFRSQFNSADFPASYVIRDGWGPPGKIFDRNEDLVLQSVVPESLRDLFSGWPLGDSQRIARLRKTLDWFSDANSIEPPEPLRTLLAALAPDLKLSDAENPRLSINGATAVSPMLASHVGAGTRRCRNGDARFVCQIHYQLQMPIQEAAEWAEAILARRLPVGGNDTAVLQSGETIHLPPDLDLNYKVQYPDQWYYNVRNWQIEMSVERERRLFSMRATFDVLDWAH